RRPGADENRRVPEVGAPLACPLAASRCWDETGPASGEGGSALDESRRNLIKKGAVGAGLVWATPMIQSMTNGAFAGTPGPTRCGPTGPCGNDGPGTGCGDPFDQCRCYSTIDGGTVCATTDGVGVFCVFAPCPPGMVCQVRCLPLPCSATSPACPPGSICVTNSCVGPTDSVC